MPKLKRRIGLIETTIYGVGIILGAGIYVLIGEAASIAGNSVWISFIIGAILASFTGLSYAELSSMYPKAAAEYVYVKKASASKCLAFLIGWLIIFTEVVSASAVSLGFASYLNGLFGLPIILTAICLIAILSFVNFIGIKQSSELNIIFTGIEILGLLLIIFLGFTFGNIKGTNYFDFSFGLKGIFAATALIFFAYIGFEDIANVAEETKNPRKVLPRAIILAIVITTLLYILTAVSTVSLANYQDLGTSTSPLAYAASQVLGDKAFLILSFIALFATANTVLILLIVNSRIMYGMANDRSLPSILSTVHKKTGTPWAAIIVSMILPILFVLIGKIDIVARITSLGAFITFAFVNASLIWLRYKHPDLHRPFKVPVNIGNLPVIAVLGLFTCSFMIFQFNLTVLLFGFLIICSGMFVYRLRKEKII